MSDDTRSDTPTLLPNRKSGHDRGDTAVVDKQPTGTQTDQPATTIGTHTDRQEPTPIPSLYVGVGASAGGLEALAEFFDHIGADSGAAFIVVQHLSPDFNSLLDELLTPHTSMPVNMVTHNTTVAPNTIYLVPPRHHLVCVDGRLQLREQVRSGGPARTIDLSFRSLAEAARHSAVGIVLSGTGSDGSRGIKAIKEAGGLILVQNRDSSSFDEMPFYAAQTETAAVIDPPAKLAHFLSAYARHLTELRRTAIVLRPATQPDGDLLRHGFALLNAASGVDFSQYRAPYVARRIEQRMAINQQQQLQDYEQLLQRTPEEVDALSRALLNPVTQFFRDPMSWDHLQKHVIVPLVSRVQEGRELRFWVAGCASGEEAYSLAIIVDEIVRSTGITTPVKIFASDADAKALARASSGRYSDDVMFDVPHQRLNRYFVKKEGYVEVRPDLRKAVVFARHNMISDPPYSNIDVVICRHVLSAFKSQVQTAALNAFHFALRTDAALFLSVTNDVKPLSTHFTLIHDRHAVYEKIIPQRLSASAQVKPTASSQNVMRPVSNVLRHYRAHQNQSTGFDYIKDHLIDQFVPACLVLNAEYEIRQLYGQASQFLKPNADSWVSCSVHEAINDELVVTLDTALSRARDDDTSISYNNLQTTVNGQSVLVNVHVTWVAQTHVDEAYYSVVFTGLPVSEHTPKESISYQADETTQQRIRDLENELQHKQAHVTAASDGLETTNEELQAANEELMSTNEELQSTNEELQSVNEELYSVNREHQEKIDELISVNDDMDNILVGTSMAMIFLDERLYIRKFTAGATHFFHLLPSDVGRPFDHLSHSLDYPNLNQDIDTVRRTYQSQTRELVTTSDTAVQVKLLPYSSSRLGDGEDMAVTIALTDLSLRSEPNTALIAKSDSANALPVSLRGAGPAKLRVLIVDDDQTDRRAITRHLAAICTLTIEPFEAVSVKEALYALKHNDIDVCLVDIHLGAESASDVLQQVRAYNETLPLILMSASQRDELEGRFPDHQLMYFLNKSEISPLLLELSLRHAMNPQ